MQRWLVKLMPVCPCPLKTKFFAQYVGQSPLALCQVFVSCLHGNALLMILKSFEIQNSLEDLKEHHHDHQSSSQEGEGPNQSIVYEHHRSAGKSCRCVLDLQWASG